MVIKSGRISLEKCLLFFVLITAFFNDWMRYKDSDITIFRIAIVGGMLICVKKKPKIFLKTLGFFMVFLIIDLIQSVLFAFYNPYGISFSLFHFAEYAYFYFCIFAVICFTYTIYELDRENFQQQYFGILKIIAIIYMLICLFEKELGNYGYKLEPNEYGAYLTAIFPLFFYEFFKEKKISHIAFCILTYIVLFIKDCKLDLFGVVLETGIIVILLLKNSRFPEIRFFSTFIMFSFIIICIFVVNSPLEMHGYALKGIIKEPLRRIITGTPYESSKSSTSYRTNEIIFGIEWIRKNYLMGIGAGNSGRLFRALIPSDEIIPIWVNKDSISLHNAWMELCVEFGIVGISFLGLIMGKVLQIFRQKKWSKFQIVAMTVGFSVWVWIMAPSGILTSYFLICLFTGLCIVNKNQSMSNNGKLLFTADEIRRRNHDANQVDR